MLKSETLAASFRSAGGIRCVIADDHEMLRYGVRRLLEDAPDFAVVGEAGDAAEALKLTPGAPPQPRAARYQHARYVVVRSRTPHRRTLHRHAHRVPDHA
jgi:hypothetical protein